MQQTMPEIPFGQRLRMLRERAGKSRPVLGGLVGRSSDWVKALETGRLLSPRLPMLLRLAEALGIDDLSELTGTRSMPIQAISKGRQPGTDSVAAALLAPNRSTTLVAEPLDQVTARVDEAWALWHRSSTERLAIAAVLPGLLAAADASARAAEGRLRRRALVEQARVYHLVQLLAAYQPSAELVWLSADRALTAARDADDPISQAIAAWYYSHVYRTGGQPDTAVDVLTHAVDITDPAASTEGRAVWGQLQLGLAIAHSKAGRGGPALRHWDLADRAAKALPAGYVHPWLMFGSAAVEAYRLTVETDLMHLGEATQLINRIEYTAMPSRTRRAFYLIESARLLRMRKDYLGTVHMLDRALRQSVDTVRHHPVARTAVLELVDRPGVTGEDARELALAMEIDS